MCKVFIEKKKKKKRERRQRGWGKSAITRLLLTAGGSSTQNNPRHGQRLPFTHSCERLSEHTHTHTHTRTHISTLTHAENTDRMQHCLTTDISRCVCVFYAWECVCVCVCVCVCGSQSACQVLVEWSKLVQTTQRDLSLPHPFILFPPSLLLLLLTRSLWYRKSIKFTHIKPAQPIALRRLQLRSQSNWPI